ncbi:probable serine/threonine-protein kinase DDB_G0275165 [Watersipora subatra]|uniref:probable serine/threonine-protein kinase DDB_G0275165 n=1 Tax=Watersipora subatra TaxID=2589382 RepID=UPI00355C6B24
MTTQAVETSSGQTNSEMHSTSTAYVTSALPNAKSTQSQEPFSTTLDSSNSSMNATDNTTEYITVTRETLTTTSSIDSITVHSTPQLVSTPKTKFTSKPLSSPKPQPTTAAKSTVKSTKPVPVTSNQASFTKSMSSTAILPEWKSAINVDMRDGESIYIRIVSSGFLKNDHLDIIQSEVEKFLKDKFNITDVKQEKIEDGETKSGEAVTILTLKAKVPTGQTAEDIKIELKKDTSFPNRIHKRIQEIDAKFGLYDGEVIMDPNTPGSSSSASKSWAETYWYVIFAIGLAVLIVIGLIILAVTSVNSRRRRQKLELQSDPEKLAHTKV